MPNIMNQLKLRNNASRNGFDLSQKRVFTAKAGELLPFQYKPLCPGDTFTFTLKSFTRTRSLNAPAYARMREYWDFYFVPAEQIWNKYPHVLTQMLQNLQHASGPKLADNTSMSGELPYITAEQIANYITTLRDSGSNNTSLHNFKRTYNTCKLLEYLGFPSGFEEYCEKGTNWSTKPMIFNTQYAVAPLLTYQKIYADWFRYSQWEKPNPSSFNVDYIKGTNDCNLDLTDIEEDFNFFDLRYSNYNKDLYFGVLPQAQYGETAVVTSTSSYSDKASLDLKNFVLYATRYDGTAYPESTPASFQKHYEFEDSQLGTTAEFSAGGSSAAKFTIKDPGEVSFRNLNSTFSILALRQAEALQRWKEVSQSVDQDYKAQIEAHWGVKCSDFLSGQSRYLGGLAVSLDLNPITNTNLVEANVADIKSTGSFTSDGNFNYTSQGEYGFIMGIYHVTPLFDYCCGQTDPMVLLTDALDYPIPELDSIGMEQVHISQLVNRPGTTGVSDPFATFVKNSQYLGYAPRYINWKTNIDVALGGFRGNSLKPWVVPFDEDMIKNQLLQFGNLDEEVSNSVVGGSLQWAFFKVNPRSLDKLFVMECDDTVDSDQFLVNCFIDCKVVRNLDVNGLPY